MEILIEKIKEDGLAFKFEKSAESFPVLAEMVANGECEFSVPIRTALRALRIGDMVEIEGDIEARAYLPCSRCLQPFETPLKSHFAFTYMRRVANAIGDSEPEEIELSAEDLAIVYFQGEKIDLKDIIQEQVVMAFPLKAICMEDCKGLCPKCGADLNKDPCDCDRRSSPGKFAVLKNLKLDK